MKKKIDKKNADLQITDEDIKDIMRCLQGVGTVLPTRRGELMWKFEAIVKYFERIKE